MKIDPIFPSPPVLNHPRYKFKRPRRKENEDPDIHFKDESDCPKIREKNWPPDVKTFLFMSLVFIIVLISLLR